MGTISDKLTYLADAVDDIQAAINEKGVEVSNEIPLEIYGQKIRDIETKSDKDDTIEIKVLDVSDVTDYVILGTLEGLTSRAYTCAEGVVPYNLNDLMAKDVSDVTDYVILGTLEGLTSRAYTCAEGVVPYNLNDLMAKDVSDVTDSITIIQKSY